MAPLYQVFSLEGYLLTLSGAAFLGIIYITILTIYNLYINPLSNYPGPKLSAISRIPYILALIQGKQHKYIDSLHQTYGTVVRVAPDELSYTNPAAFKDIYAHRQGKPEMSKNKIFHSQHPGGDTLLVETRAEHGRQRKNLAHGFSDTSMRLQEPMLCRYIDLLIRRLKERSNDGKTVLDFCSWYNFTTFDIIGTLTFGESFGCLEKGTYHPWVSMIFDNIIVSSYLKAFKYIWGGQSVSSFLVPRRLLDRQKDHFQMTIEKVKNRLSFKEERPDFLGAILKRDNNTLTFDQLTANSSLLIIAGSETTATLLSGVTYHLLKNPDKLKKVVDEVRTAFSSDDEITINSVSGLKYLLACLNEGLRMYPPVPVGLPRIVPEGGDFIAGKWVPGSTIVSVSQYSTYHSPANFHDCDSFIPERFLGEDPKFANDNLAALNPFSLGPRNCIGKNLAYAEMRLILSKILFNFDLELANKGFDWLDQKIYILWKKNDLNVLVKEAVR